MDIWFLNLTLGTSSLPRPMPDMSHYIPMYDDYEGNLQQQPPNNNESTNAEHASTKARQFLNLSF